MALISCYECEKQISSDASFCPECGAPNLNQSQLVKVDQTSDLERQKIQQSHRSNKGFSKVKTISVIFVGLIGIPTAAIFFKFFNARQVGNMCPSGYGYVGGSYCKRVDYFRGTIDGYPWGGDKRLLGKGWPDKRTWAGVRRTPQFMKRSIPIKTGFNIKCPWTEPEVGRNNSCQNGFSEEEIRKATPPIGMDPHGKD